MYSKKICIVGAGGVGKTSLIQRFLDGRCSGDPLATVGANIGKKVLDIDGEKLQLMLWDIQGGDRLSSRDMNYLRGAAAIVYVVDGTRLQTLDAALALRLEIESRLGRRLPSILLFNKSDLAQRWEISNTMINDAEADGICAILTSSKEGGGVNLAFNLISRVIIGKTTLIAA